MPMGIRIHAPQPDILLDHVEILQLRDDLEVCLRHAKAWNERHLSVEVVVQQKHLPHHIAVGKLLLHTEKEFPFGSRPLQRCWCQSQLLA